MASRYQSPDQFLSPNRAKMPDVFVVQDFSVPVSPCLPPCNSPTFGMHGGTFLSPGSIDSLNKRSNSTVSSIFDLSIESDQLDRALKSNDANAVMKFLQVHRGKFPLSLPGSSVGDKYSSESRSRRPSSRTSHQTSFFDRMDPERRESVTPECDIPDIFRTSLHVAVVNNAIDVIRVLLRYGIDPNEPSGNLINSERRPSFFNDSVFSHMDKHRPDCLPEETSEVSVSEMSGSVTVPTISFLSPPGHQNTVSPTPPSPTTSSRGMFLSSPAHTKGASLCVPETIPYPAGASTIKPQVPQSPPLPLPTNAEHMSEKPRASFAISHDFDLVYTQEELFKIPPLFIAVSEKQIPAINMLLQYGADVNARDRHGFSPLHLAAYDETYHIDSCTLLLRYGAKINLTSKTGRTPCDFRSNLPEIQKNAIQDILAGRPCPGSDRCMETLKVNGKKRISWSSNSDSNSRSFGKTGSIKKKLFKRSESKERERAAAKERKRNESVTTDMFGDLKDYGSNASSYRSSRGRIHSSAITEDLDTETFLHVPCVQQDSSSIERGTTRSIASRMSLRRGDKTKHRNSCAPDPNDKSTLEETEKSLKALIKLAANPECVSSLVEGLGNYMKLVLALIEQTDAPTIERAINELFNQIIQTVYDQLKGAKDYEEKVDYFYDLSRLLNIAFELFKGKQSLHFTALTTVNRIIDMCIVYRNYEISTWTKSSEHVSPSEIYKHHSPKQKGSQFQSEENTALNRHFSLSRKERRMSHDAHSKETHEKHNSDDHEESKSSSLSNCTQVHRTPLEILTSTDPCQILSILHNNITMHKRIIGTRQKCTPSTRWRQCTHHCLQILSARILTVMCHGPTVQHKLVSDGHAKTLVEALDPNHDPHLLCLLLQSLSSIALNPAYHQILTDADIADMLMQLLLPSDEWYYTNHSTKYARYVKYHAARILVYLGQLHRLGGRVDLFDTKLFQEEVAANIILQVHSPEDSFIELMALGRIVMWNDRHHLEAASLEGVIAQIIEEAMSEEVDSSPPNSGGGLFLAASLQSLCSMKDISSCRDFVTPPISPTCSIQSLHDLTSKSFREFFFMALPMIVHPVIVLRLLAHRMFGNMIRRKNLCAQDSKLKPPKEENLVVEVMCPPRSNSESAKSRLELSMRRRDSEHGLGTDSGARSSVCCVTSTKTNNVNTQSHNGTKLALRAIGESLVTPLEMNINSGKEGNEHRPLSYTQSDSLKGSKPRLFRWQSKKHLSKSQANVSMLHTDSLMSLNKVDSEPTSTVDVDIVAFQRELINLPTFVMDTPIDISPVFSRSSSVPENLASRLNPNTGSLCQLSAHSSRKRLSKSGCGSELAVSTLPHSSSVVTITMTGADLQDSIFFFPSRESTSDTPEDSMANIIVHFDPPQSPMLSSASQSPQGFDFPNPSSTNQTANLLQPNSSNSNTANSVGAKGGPPVDGSTGGTPSLPHSDSHCEAINDSKPSLIKPEHQKVSPANSPINEMAAPHRAVLKIIETWISVCRADLESYALVIHEMREFLKKLSVLGPEYKVWCQRISGELHLEEKLVSNQRAEGPDDSKHAEYKQLQELILSGELPCSKEEAATLAGIQLHLEEAWPEDNITNGPYRILDRKMTDTSSGKGHKSSDAEKQENLRRKKELIRSNKARGITLSRRKGRLVKQLSCVSDNEVDTSIDVDLAQFLPPHYTTSKKVKTLIEEKQKKLWHTPYYDSEIKLKQLYIKICKNLPGYSCKLYHVKELLRGNTQKKVSRLLGISSEKVVLLDFKSKLLAKSQSIRDLDEWRTGSGKSHDGLVLEFRGTKTWTLSMPSLDSLKSVTAVLWDALDMHGRFLNSSTLRRDSFEFDFQRKQLTLCPDREGSCIYSQELETLQKMLHFPEEVAFLLTKTETGLFQKVPPSDYIRQVTLDLSHGTTVTGKVSRVEELIQRFNEVSTWVTQLIITQPTHDNRKAVLSCILRLAQYCWCIGNFNSAMEILAGLKSEKLKPFWLLLSEEDLSTLHTLSNALFSREPTPEYRDAVSAALDIKECQVVPFFGGFLRDLRSIFMSTPSLVVLPSTENQSLEFISDYNGEDRFMTRIGVGGLINMEKLKKSHTILSDIQLFHYHSNAQASSRHDDAVEGVDSNESDCDLDFDSYQPIKPLTNEQEVMIITPKLAHLSHQVLQSMHHGMTVVHWEGDSGRSCMCYLKVEVDNSTLTWRKPNWSALRGTNTTIPDYVLRGDFDNSSIQVLYTRYSSGDTLFESLEEGYIDMRIVKDVCFEAEESIDLSVISKRYGLENLTPESNCICLIYGTSIAENKKLYFIAPSHVASVWHTGLSKLAQAAKKLHRQTDKRMQWLKVQYLQLYYEDERCQGPTPAEAIRVFGGRRWPPGGSQMNSNISEPPSSFKRTSSFVMGSTIFRKKPLGSFPMSRQETSSKTNLQSGNSSTSLSKTTSSSKTKRSPSPQSKQKQASSRPASSASDPQINSPGPVRGSLNSSLGQRSHNQQCNSFLNRYRSRRRMSTLGKQVTGDSKNSSITHSTRLSFLDFVDLFRSFSLRCRKDLRGLFEQFAILKPNLEKQSKPVVHSTTSLKDGNVLTRNTPHDLNHSNDTQYQQRRKICDAIAVSSIFENCAGVDTSQNRCLGLKEFREFLEDYQEEHLDDNEIIGLIQSHEPDISLRGHCFLSFEGFAKYLMDKENYAYIYEKTKHNDEDMDHPLAHYYIASSHNTYLTAHQLKGESSVELYSQILLMGCRCVELDCWDGDDGMPIIYHGHTLTTKISFKAVCEAINKSAFISSAYPIILSLENHCSIPQQQKMAQIFTSVFGEKLVTQFLFDSDFMEDPVLPSPNQLKHKILIKNKKIWEDQDSHTTMKRVSPYSRNYGTMTEGTVNDFDDEDDDDDEEDDVTDVKDSRRSMDSQESRVTPEPDDKSKENIHPSGSYGELARRPSGYFNDKIRPKSHPELDWQFDDDIQDVKVLKTKQKKTSQIAKELSDLVVYMQAVKFRGLNVSPNSSLKNKQHKQGSRKIMNTAVPPGTMPSNVEKVEQTIQTNISLRQKRPDNTPSCYLVSSLNENKAKQMCRRNPTPVINHTEKQLMRTYPAGMRIDSSNFNPVIFWAFGIQMVALNYQTEDTAMALNTAMFEQNGQSGYVLKPAVKWDKSHVMYNHFNPWDKEFDGLHTTVFTLHVISGQYVCNNFTASTQVEVEVIGIPVDCAKNKSKVISRNSLNPIWNDVFTFQVMYSDLAFIRFVVIDTNTSHIVSQRIIPLKCLRPGYRHVRLRNLSNQPLELATLFIYSKHEEELLEPCSRIEYDSTSAILKSVFSKVKDLSELGKDGKDVHLVSPMGTKLKRRMFFISVFGVTAPDDYVILKVTQDTSVYDAIAQALIKAGRMDEKVGDHVLVEDVQNSWEKKEQERSSCQRILSMSEKVLQAQNKWKGAGKFVLRKVSTDPSSRAWVTTMLSKEQRVGGHLALSWNNLFNITRKIDADNTTGDWDREEHMFLVCVYNVSPDQPYTIFKAPTTSTAQDIITQAMMKAHRSDEEDPRNFFLLEELDAGSDSHSSGGKKRDSEKVYRRILASDESVCQAQSEWKTNGRFVLVDRDMVEFDPDMISDKKKKNVKLKSALFHTNTMTTTLARKFCAKLSKTTSEQSDASLVEKQSPPAVTSPTSVTACEQIPSSVCSTPVYQLSTSEPVSYPSSPSSQSHQSSSKWKRLLKLGK